MKSWVYRLVRIYFTVAETLSSFNNECRKLLLHLNRSLRITLDYFNQLTFFRAYIL